MRPLCFRIYLVQVLVIPLYISDVFPNILTSGRGHPHPRPGNLAEVDQSSYLK